MTTRTLRRPTGRTPNHSLRLRPSSFPAPIKKRLGLVCAGGGVTGAIYEIGALAAIEDRLDGISLTDFDVFVGVSSGAYISALVANRVTPALLYRNVMRSVHSGTALDDLALFRLNVPEIASRLAVAPLTIFEAAWDFYRNRDETTLTDLVQSLGRILPSGIFLNDGLEKWMAEWLRRDGRTDDFRKLRNVLRIVAVELETGETCAFGARGHDDVPISRAVRASCAIPALYQPARINGIEYIDGGVRKTANISLALRERCGLTLCINPIVPFRMPAAALRNGAQGKLSRMGLTSILDQVFRVSLHSRMRYGIERYHRERPDADVLVFEPRSEEIPRFMSTNIMRTSARKRIAEWAYYTTMEAIDADFVRLSRVFARHGLTLRAGSAQPSESARFLHALAADESEPTPRRLAASLDLLEEKLREMPERKRKAG